MNVWKMWNKSLLPPFLLMTLSVILLTILSQYLVEDSLQNIKSDVQLMKVANDQQVLSLQITKEISTDQLQGQLMGLPVDSLVAVLAFTQNKMLTASNVSANAEAYNYEQLSKAYNDFNAAVSLSLKSDNNSYLVNLLNKQRIYLEELQNFIIAIGERSNKKISNFQLHQRTTMVGSILILALESVFVFFPAFEKIKEQNNRLKRIAYHQSHMIRRPLANIKGLLHLLEISGIEEREKLIEIIKNETEQLDDVVRNTVIDDDE